MTETRPFVFGTFKPATPDSLPAERSLGQSAPARIQRKRSRGWKMPANTVVVNRTTGFGNPFPVVKATGKHMGETSEVWVVGTWSGPAMWIRDTKDDALSISVGAFEQWIKHPAQARLLARVRLLRGKNLACWCPLDKPCHADVLLELANG